MSVESDPVLSSLYREGAREEPPHRLDAAIAAAVRDELVPQQAAESERRSPRWHVPFALAAVLVLAVSLTWLADPMEQDRDSYPSANLASEVPVERRELAPPQSAAPPLAPPREAKRAESSGEVASAPPPARKASSADSAVAQGRAPSRPALPETPALGADERQRANSRETDAPQFDAAGRSVLAAPASPPASALREGSAESSALAAPAPKASEDFHTGRARVDRAQAAPLRRERSTPPPAEEPEGSRAPKTEAATPGLVRKADPGMAAKNAQEQASRSPEQLAGGAHPSPGQWVREIEELLRQGQDAEARLQLEAFRKRFPDYDLPRALRAH